MATKGQSPASSKAVEPRSEVTGYEDDQEVIEATVVAAQRAGQYALDRGYGPATVELISHIAGRAIDTRDLNVVIIEQMAARFAEATDADSILDPFGTVKGSDLLGRPLYVTAVEFLESDVEGDGFPWYASFSVLERTTGKSRVVTVGGEKLVMQAAALDRAGLWPQEVAIHESEKETKAGFHPLELRKAGAAGAAAPF